LQKTLFQNSFVWKNIFWEKKHAILFQSINVGSLYLIGIQISCEMDYKWLKKCGKSWHIKILKIKVVLKKFQCNLYFKKFIWWWVIIYFNFDYIMTFFKNPLFFIMYVWKTQCYHFKSSLWIHFFFFKPILTFNMIPIKFIASYDHR